VAFDFNASFVRNDIVTSILTEPYLGSGSATAAALELADDLLTSVSSGYRPQLPSVVVLITDGESQV
jgi:hypothetical protein